MTISSEALINYAIIQAQYDTNKNYLDNFSIFVLAALLDITSTTQSLNDILTENYNLNIPGHVVNKILKRNKKLGFIVERNGEHELTSIGRTKASTFKKTGKIY